MSIRISPSSLSQTLSSCLDIRELPFGSSEPSDIFSHIRGTVMSSIFDSGNYAPSVKADMGKET
jgi:hypothetical protein